jgi:hypothetical protein
MPLQELFTITQPIRGLTTPLFCSPRAPVKVAAGVSWVLRADQKVSQEVGVLSSKDVGSGSGMCPQSKPYNLNFPEEQTFFVFCSVLESRSTLPIRKIEFDYRFDTEVKFEFSFVFLSFHGGIQ